MIDVYSVVGGVIGGSLLLLADRVLKWIQRQRASRKAHFKWLEQQERLKERKLFRDRKRVGIKKI